MKFCLNNLRLFIKKYKPTVEDFSWIEYETGCGETVLIKMIDHSGSHDFAAMRDLYVATANAFMLVCATDDAQSVIEMENLLELIKANNTKV